MGSLNLRLLTEAAAACRAAGSEVTALRLTDFPLPIYDGDLEDAHGVPENAQRLAALITEYPALLIATPEYNATFPLNGLWPTRVAHVIALAKAGGKVAALLGASPGVFGGLRAVAALRAVLTHLGVHVIPQQVLLPAADQAFDAAGQLIQERTRTSMRGLAEALVTTTSRLRDPRT